MLANDLTEKTKANNIQLIRNSDTKIKIVVAPPKNYRF